MKDCRACLFSVGQCVSKYCDKLVKGAHVHDLLQLMNDSSRITLSICMLKGS